MKVEIINVIQIKDGVLSCDSFTEESQAEQKFFDLAKEAGHNVSKTYFKVGFFQSENYQIYCSINEIEINDPIIDAMNTLKTLDGFESEYQKFTNSLIFKQK